MSEHSIEINDIHAVAFRLLQPVGKIIVNEVYPPNSLKYIFIRVRKSGYAGLTNGPENRAFLQRYDLPLSLKSTIESPPAPNVASTTVRYSLSGRSFTSRSACPCFICAMRSLAVPK